MIGHGMPVYSGYATQQGYGLGNVLGGLFRAAIPVAKRAAKNAARAALNTGLQMVQKKLAAPKKKKATKGPPKTVRKNKRKGPPGKRVSTAKKQRVDDVFSKQQK